MSAGAFLEELGAPAVRGGEGSGAALTERGEGGVCAVKTRLIRYPNRSLSLAFDTIGCTIFRRPSLLTVTGVYSTSHHLLGALLGTAALG